MATIPKRSKIEVVHWKPEEITSQLAMLQKAGYAITCRGFDQEIWKKLRANPPEVLIIDLSRLPSHGREVGLAMRQSKSTRNLPLIFVGGPPEKVEKVKNLLPDAWYCEWRNVRGTITKALAAKPDVPVVPESIMAGYSGTPLPKKLGVKPNSTLTLVNAPHGFIKTLEPLPDGLKVKTQARGKSDLVIWFVTTRKEYEKRLPAIGKLLSDKGGLWVAWPKKASGMNSDLTQADVRREGLAIGMVDHKIAAIDFTWSGLRFVWRK